MAKEQVRVYQVLLDIGTHIPGILVINPHDISQELYQKRCQQNEIYSRMHDIQLDFGISSNSYRFAGITDAYNDIFDLVVKMIDTAVDATSKGLQIKGKNKMLRPELIKSVDASNLYVPKGFIIPTGLSQMFRNPATVHEIDFSLPQVGRLANIITAGTYNLLHEDDFDRDDPS